MLDTVEGVAVALSEDQIKILDEHHKHIGYHGYRKSIHVKPTDLGPIYKEPVSAEAYIIAVDSPAEYFDANSGPRKFMQWNKYGEDWDNEALNKLAMNIYMHNRL